jgi:hypothetical protein
VFDGGTARPSSMPVCLLVFLISLLTISRARAEDYEILKQKKCVFLVTPSTGLTAGQSFQARTNSGRNVVLKVRKKSKDKATLSMRSRDGRCQKISGAFKTEGSPSDSVKKFSFGVTANGGLFSIKQIFTPTPEAPAEGEAEVTAPKPVVGLSGIGFSGGVLLRYHLSSSLGLELAISGLTATPSGKTLLENNDDYSVSAKVTEVVVQPALAVTRCLAKRLYCKAGGIFGVPLGAKLFIKSSEENQQAVLKYMRFGGEASAGVNLTSAITINVGGQFTIISGSFSFPPDNNAILFRPFTAYLFSGLVVAL